MQPSGSQPNIVLVHCHDLGDWLPCYGKETIPSPNLTRFSAESLVFDSAFATSPLCTPARSSLFSGQMPHNNGLMGLTHQGWQYNTGVSTLPEMLAETGYRTALIGLQHEDLDARVLGYEEVHGLGFLPRALEVARLSQRWLSTAHEDARPFFAAVGFWEVHRPWPVEDYEAVDPAEVEVPAYLPDNEHTRRDIAQFYGAIRQMDEAFGLVLEGIEQLQTKNETLVIFTTDHGVAFPRAKSTLYDAGVKVAFLVRPPASWGIEPGHVSTMVSHLDVAPTLLDLAGAPVPDTLEGISLRSLLLREQQNGNDERTLVFEKTYHDRYDPLRGIRSADAKYIRNFVEAPQLPLPTDLEESETRRGMSDDHLRPRPAEELYLLKEDPDELNNVADVPDFEGLRSRMAKALETAMRQSNDPILDGKIPEPVVPHRDAREAKRDKVDV